MTGYISKFFLFFSGGFDSAGLKKYTFNTGWIFLARIIMILASFVATMVVARQLGPKNYGELSYAVSFVALFSFITTLGIDSVLYKELIVDPSKKNKILGSALTMRLIAASIGILLCVGVAYFFSSADVSFWVIVILSLSFIFYSFNIINSEFQADVQAKWISRVAIIVTIIINILKIVTVSMGYGVLYLALIIFFESFLTASSYIYVRYKIFGSILNWCFDMSTAKKLLIDSWPFIFSAVFAVIYSRIDQVMLKNIVDATTVGIYDAAVRLSEIWFFIPGIIVGSLFPAMINAKKTSRNEYLRRIKKLIILLLFLSLSIVTIVFFFSKTIVLIVFGGQFLETITVLQIYIWSFIPFTFITLFQQILLANNEKVALFGTSMIGMLMNVITNFFLIPIYFATGAALATLTSSSVTFVLLTFFLFYKYKKSYPA